MPDTFAPTSSRRQSDSFTGSIKKTAVQTVEELGYEIPKQKGWSLLGKKFLNVVSGVLDVLRTGEYAMGGILSGKSPITGIREKISPSEVLFKDREEERKLWSKKGIAGLAADILLDPITYLTFGTAGVMKLATKGGQVSITKAGQKLMRTIIERGTSEAAARRTMARIIQEGGEEAAKKYIGKRGLKFMGQVFMPAEYFERAGKVVGKIPGAGYVGKVGNAVARAFVPFSEIDKLPAKIGGKGMYTDFLYKPFERETRQEIFKNIDEIKKISDETIKKYGKDIGKKLGYKIEKGKLTGDNFLDTVVTAYRRDADQMLKIEKATGKKIGEIDNYLRHYLTPEGRKFIDKEGDALRFLPKPLKAKLKAATPRKIPGTIKEINAFYKTKYGVNKFFEEDFFKAWALRKAEHIKFVNTHKFLEQTKVRFGARLDRAKTRFTDEGLELVESTNPQMKGWLLPKPIVKHIDDTIKFLSNEETTRGLIKAYDWMLKHWKVHVTGMFPAFHTRNFIGGYYNNWLAKVNNIDYITTERILRGSDLTIKTDIGTKYSGKQILDLSERFGIKGQPGMMDVYRKVGEEIELIAASDIKKAGIKASNAPRWIMEQVENRLRIPLFINRLKKGYSPSEAAKDVFKFHFDYVPTTGLTPFEQTVMRRLIPFYVWTRNNIPLQLEQMMKQPGKYANLEKLRQSLFTEKQKAEFKDLPEWMREMFIFPLSMKDDLGRDLWMQLDLPLDDIRMLPVSSQGVKQIASTLTPFLKYPIERYMNRNFYFGGDIWNPDVLPEMQTKETIGALKLLPSPIKKYLNFREVKYRDWTRPDKKVFINRYEMDAKKLHFLQTFIGRYYATLKGFFDEDIPMEWRVSRYVGGVPVRSVDIEEERGNREREQETQAEATLNWLKQHNIIPYKQKGKKDTFAP